MKTAIDARVRTPRFSPYLWSLRCDRFQTQQQTFPLQVSADEGFSPRTETLLGGVVSLRVRGQPTFEGVDFVSYSVRSMDNLPSIGHVPLSFLKLPNQIRCTARSDRLKSTRLIRLDNTSEWANRLKRNFDECALHCLSSVKRHGEENQEYAKMIEHSASERDPFNGSRQVVSSLCVANALGFLIAVCPLFRYF